MEETGTSSIPATAFRLAGLYAFPPHTCPKSTCKHELYRHRTQVAMMPSIN